MPTWIDTHCHLDAPEFDADRVAVRERARTAGVAHCVLPAVDADHFDAIRALDAQGIEVSDLILRRPTLDDVFLTLTGHAAEDDTQAPEPARGRRGRRR